MTVAHSNGSMSEFPRDEWAVECLIAAVTPLAAAKRLMDLDAIRLPDLTREGECAAMAERAQRRAEPGRAKKVLHEATAPRAAMATVLKSAGLDIDASLDRDLIDWRDIVINHVDGVVWRLKLEFDRPRPYHNCNELTVLDGVPRPPHASYPSGHATMAHTCAMLLGRARLKEAKRFRDVAADVALNREIAGVHFPSDSEAGEELARQIVDGMLSSSAPASKRFFELMRRLE